jgi:hypothetical protein
MNKIKEVQTNECKKCINSELVEFTDNTESYYLCHEVNEKIDNIDFKKECQCFDKKEKDDKMLICISKCPELDFNNEKHCMILQSQYDYYKVDECFCPCGNKETLLDLDVYNSLEDKNNIKITQNLLDNPETYVYKLRNYGVCVFLFDRSSGHSDYVLVNKEYILDGSINKLNDYNRKFNIFQITTLDSYDLKTLKLKNEDDNILNVEGFDIIAYKDCKTMSLAVAEYLSNDNIKWDWEE